MEMFGKRVFYSGKENGFSLIELLVVVSVIAILMAIMFPVLSGIKNNALRKLTETEAKGLASAIRAYHSEFNAWPGVSSDNDQTWTGDNKAVVQLLINQAGRNFYEGVKVNESVLDPFSNAYRIKISPTNDSVTVWSCGLNRIDDGGAGDDIQVVH